MSQLWDPRAAVTAHAFEKGECRIVCNNNFAQVYMSAEEMEYNLRHYAILPVLQWAR